MSIEGLSPYFCRTAADNAALSASGVLYRSCASFHIIVWIPCASSIRISSIMSRSFGAPFFSALIRSELTAYCTESAGPFSGQSRASSRCWAAPEKRSPAKTAAPMSANKQTGINTIMKLANNSRFFTEISRICIAMTFSLQPIFLHYNGKTGCLPNDL